MKKSTKIFGGVLLIGMLGVGSSAQAGVITSNLGNTASGLVDGNTYALVPTLLAVQAGQPAPFDAGKGNELFSNLNETWTHNFGAIADTILSATISFGIVDHDSAATGNQVALFSVDSADLTGALNTAANAAGEGADGQYDIYTFNLTNFADLADGLANIALTLTGPGLQTALIGGGVSESSFNGAHLIFSTLTINTEDSGQVPEPSTLAVSMLGLAAMGWRQRRRKS